MKPIFFTTVAVLALSTVPSIAQQSGDSFVPGASFLTNWDADEDGKVTLDELSERRGDVFAGFDENEDGALSAEEYRALDEARMGTMQRPDDRGNGAGRGEQVWAFDAADADKDGAVSLEEFAGASAQWMQVMDSNGDSVLTVEDFGQGARQDGQGQRPAMGQGNGQGRGQGKGQGRGQGQGQGRGQGQGQGQGRQSDVQSPAQGMGQPQQGRAPGKDRGYAQQGRQQGQEQRAGQGRGHGQQGGQGKMRGQQTAAFEAVPTSDGTLWIVDARTGDILACKSVADSTAAAGFTPVCVEVGQ
ncbi:EF-hand domain-containing protein [Tropicimonas sp. TH_r6]|uniref:EF-hand domain-containing protein n=1 Tax=Tropicimonas sp. TH_r6 TaxID=3082085 RepID=UPI002955ABFB|nr:EF-hand domain-containing protein [Tropicimonas sp. TH_r6]MDV7145219.1 EF-hand domain-containing protein [Tropicimonas sp. TH_r6]